MINIRSAKQMDIDRVEMIYNHIHDEKEKGIWKSFCFILRRICKAA